MKKEYLAPPAPSSLLTSLRSIGYSIETAVADLVDNSISAEASHICIEFVKNEDNSFVSISDDGIGMTEEELFNAMKIGYMNPNADRNINDLGRFGMGLKTASFSQCKSLTVISKSNNSHVSCMRWDLDYLNDTSNNEWAILPTPSKNAENLISLLESKNHGTIVIWDKLDRLLPLDSTDQNLLDIIDKVERHLAITFQRYIDGIFGAKKVEIKINRKKIKSIDPFMSSNSFTQNSPEEQIKTKSGYVKIQEHILPFIDNLSDREIQWIGWDQNMNSLQGFYIYRNNRLLVEGSWLGLGIPKAWTKEEAYKLARISIDITNSSDYDWKIDIMKSKASAPIGRLREILTGIGARARCKSRQVFAYRGCSHRIKSEKDDFVPVWVPFKDSKNHTFYKINKSHPLIETIKSRINDKELFNSLLNCIESSVPVREIWVNSASGEDAPVVANSEEFSKELINSLELVLGIIMKNGDISLDEAMEKVKDIAPFNDYQDLLSNYIEGKKNG